MATQASPVASIERVLLATSIDTDHGPHAMIVWVKSHARPPAQVQNRQIIRRVDRIYARALRISKRAHNLPGITNCSSDQLLDCSVGVRFPDCSTAFFNESVCLKHGCTSDQRTDYSAIRTR